MGAVVNIKTTQQAERIDALVRENRELHAQLVRSQQFAMDQRELARQMVIRLVLVFKKGLPNEAVQPLDWSPTFEEMIKTVDLYLGVPDGTEQAEPQ